MATATGTAHCITCGKEKVAYKCEGCSQNFCINHLNEHHQLIIKQFDDLENKRNIFRENLTEQITYPQKHLLLKEINQWEKDSINKIQQIAEETRQLLIKYTNEYMNQIEIRLIKLTEELKQIRQEDDFNEINLNQLNQKLQQLEEELDKPSSISIQQESSTFINKIFVITPFDKDKKWKQQGIIVAGGNGFGDKLNQLYHPFGMCIDDDQTIYIADCLNCRIFEWKCNATNGQIVAGGNGRGNQTNQLNSPRDVIIDKENNSLIISDNGNRRVMRWSRRKNTKNGEIIIKDIDCWGLTMDKNGSLYVSDRVKNEVRRWKRGDQNETIVAGGNGKGNNLNQLNYPTHIFVDEDYSLYVSDNNNHRVMKWLKDAKEGIVVAGGNARGNSLTQLSYPYEVIVDELGQIYVADGGNDRVMRWCKGAREGTIVVGGNGKGKQSNQFNGPVGLSSDRQGNLYVADYWNQRIQKFEIN